MRDSFQMILKKSRMKHLFETKRCFESSGKIGGFIVDFSDALVLLHNLNVDTFALNGYTVIRVDDITRYRIFSRQTYWRARAAAHFGLEPKRPVGITLESLPKLLTSINERYPLITFHREEKNPDVCYIGPVLSMTERTVTIDDLNASCEWTGSRRLKFDDITRIDFGGGYEEALAVTASKRRKP